MTKPLVVIGAIAALLSGTYSASSAFTTEPANPATMSNRLADPDDLADKMSNGQSGGTVFGLPGGPTLQFSAPPLSDGVNSRFVTSPSTVYVPSEHR